LPQQHKKVSKPKKEKMDMKIDDKDSVMANLFGFNLDDASDRLKDDKDLVLAIVEVNPSALIYASKRLKDDETVVLAAVKKNAICLVYASARLRSDVNFCIACAKISKKSIDSFLGEAKEIFQAHNNDIVAVEKAYTQQQNKAN
jgi:hypothetical protein